MTTADPVDRSFGSSFDPLLSGVAQGLATLFPPIENTRRPASEDEAGHSHEVEDERPDE
ncbi:hypothetical protein [Methylobacterium haplocladii]|uniref:Uncharacterized protein n=2 Tax=Methylobacterium haplocladii TaxID=1176176 RepID=A0A512IU53_9HYPH|nr:hypothetical protein [Methylobacterium haplocladii]GEP01186.1 hypothetical protein MHA02_35730 [Methylobacterium haplocladii]GJD82855.1 hypothetical protein HPGCJGGD_0717 [Methylobacterium haplocladii]GLS58990.1 hypothetical protein GCM10007887_16560 [Methylobacterium haplocladii]